MSKAIMTSDDFLNVPVEHTMYIGPPIFPVFNDRPLGMEPITNADVVPFVRSDNAAMNFATDCAWSSDAEWFFVILPEGIALFNVFARERRGLLCTIHSGAFIGACLDSGLLSSSLRKPHRRPVKTGTVERAALRGAA